MEGKTFTSFTHQVVDDAFGPVRTAQDTFETIAPPDDAARSLHPQVLDALAHSRREWGASTSRSSPAALTK